MTLDDKQVKEFLCNETSFFALNVIDLENNEVIYTNKAMKDIMANQKAQFCWQALYGEPSRCAWCKVGDIDPKIDQPEEQKPFEYEHFNDIANRWYKVQGKIARLEDNRKVLISVLIDISSQKAAQGQLINMQVSLAQKADALEGAQKELELLASLDPLTRLYNRRYFAKAAKTILDLAKRNKKELTIVMLDIDNFKAINDLYGHKVGDNVIIELAKELEVNTRNSDVICRFGGEEFIILLPETDMNGAKIIAEKIRKNTEKILVNTNQGRDISFTVSLGLSSVDITEDNSIEPAISRADKAMYEAKKSGKNRTCEL